MKFKHKMAESDNSVPPSSSETLNTISSSLSTDENKENETDKAMGDRIFLLEDYRPQNSPQTLQNLFNTFESLNIPATRYNVIAGIIYIVMLETGFVPYEYSKGSENFNFDYKRILALTKILPSSFFSYKDVFSEEFVLGSILQYPVRLVLRPALEDIIVNCMILESNYKSTYSYLLDPLQYIASNEDIIGITKLQNLRGLSLMLKEEVFLKCKQDIVEKKGLYFNNFMNLPHEIIIYILGYLKVRDVVNIIKTCRELRLVGDDNRVWRSLYLRDIDKQFYGMSGFKERYKEEYVRRRRSRSRISRHLIFNL